MTRKYTKFLNIPVRPSLKHPDLGQINTLTLSRRIIPRTRVIPEDYFASCNIPFARYFIMITIN